MIQWHDIPAILSEIYAPKNIYIESTLKALQLLVSEIDVLLWKWSPFKNKNDLQNGGYNGMIYRQYFF